MGNGYKAIGFRGNLEDIWNLNGEYVEYVGHMAAENWNGYGTDYWKP